MKRKNPSFSTGGKSMETEGKLPLYEAVELRAEMEARIKTLESLRPEGEGRGLFRERDAETQPAPGFDLASIETGIEFLKARRRRLNALIQEANHRTIVDADGRALTLAEALELRKETNADIGRLATELRDAAWLRIIHKEERDVVRNPPRSFSLIMELLEGRRRLFRRLVKAIHEANHRTILNFRDET
jgi:hypothetical protein